MNCNAGKEPCTTGKKFSLTTVPVLPADLEIVKSAVRDISYQPGPRPVTRSIPAARKAGRSPSVRSSA